MSNERTLVIVSGYIRQQSQALCNWLVIPVDVISICCLFYSNSFKIFIHEHSTNNTETFRIYDINTKTKSKLLPLTKFRTHSLSSLSFPFCYINNISFYLKIPPRCNGSDINPHLLYDGIIGLQKKAFFRPVYYPCIMIFESNKIGDKKIKYHRFFSTKPTYAGFNQFIWCESYGIIHEKIGHLYQMKLSNVDLNHIAPNFQFKKIYRSTFWNKPDGHLSMVYMQKHCQIFALGLCEGRQIQCKTFNFDDNKWSSYRTYYCLDQVTDNNMYIPLHNKYHANIVYAISNDGHIGKFDIEKNRWNTLITSEEANIKMDTNFVTWMDNRHVVCCSDNGYGGYFDVRSKHKAWCSMHTLKHGQTENATLFV
eukprot:521463_1